LYYKLCLLRGAPQSSKDPDIDEWVRDAQSAIDCRGLKSKEALQYVTEHLACDARTEIDSRSDVTTVEDIFTALRSVFDSEQTLS
jgi:hypothetical protein